MTKEQAQLRGEKSDFTEEQRPTSGFTSSRKRRMIIIAVVVTIIVIAVIIATVVAVVITQTGKEDSELQKSDHWCGLTLPAGVNMSDLGGPKLLSGGPKTCDITGTCWKKEQCYPCMEGPNRDRVGNINDIPVCCPHCERYGLSITSDTCDCRY